jgi:hypothetical protein
MADNEAQPINITEDGGITKTITKEGSGDLAPSGYEVTCECLAAVVLVLVAQFCTQ